MMNNLVDKDGRALLDIMDNRDISRIEPDILAWEIKRSGSSWSDYDKRRHKLLKRILVEFPGAYIEYGENPFEDCLKGHWRKAGSETIEKPDGLFNRGYVLKRDPQGVPQLTVLQDTIPTPWIIPPDADTVDVLHWLASGNWILYVSYQPLKPFDHVEIDQHATDFVRRKSIPLLLTSSHDNEPWIITLNPDSELLKDNNWWGIENLDNRYPDLGEFLGRWFPFSDLKGFIDDNEVVRWYACAINDEKRDGIIQQSEDLLKETPFPFHDLARLIERAFGTPESGHKWLAKITAALKEIHDYASGEAGLISLMNTIIDEYKPKIAKRFDIECSSTPHRGYIGKYSSKILVKISTQSVIESIPTGSLLHIFDVPLYSEGNPLNEDNIRDSIKSGFNGLPASYWRSRAQQFTCCSILIIPIFLIIWLLSSCHC